MMGEQQYTLKEYKINEVGIFSDIDDRTFKKEGRAVKKVKQIVKQNIGSPWLTYSATKDLS